MPCSVKIFVSMFTLAQNSPIIGEWSIKSFIYLSSKHLLDAILHGHEAKTSMLKCKEGTGPGGGGGGW